jgi:membrane-associated phospholipid phosphatase
VRCAALAVGIAVLSVPAAATAGDDPSDFDASELYDAGAIAFVYAPAALALGLHYFGEPPAEPRLFDAAEGGARNHEGREVPGWTIQLAAGASFAGIIASDDDSRWFHAKGLTQSWATSAALTGVAKTLFGRRRPDWASDNDVPASRKSFFSGHTSLAAVTATYLGLYLREHAFADARGELTLPWWEALSYAGLAGASIYVPYTRVRDHRHHLSDVVVGALAGAAIAAAFYTWQERRYEDAIDGAQLQSAGTARYSRPAPVLQLRFTF